MIFNFMWDSSMYIILYLLFGFSLSLVYMLSSRRGGPNSKTGLILFVGWLVAIPYWFLKMCLFGPPEIKDGVQRSDQEKSTGMKSHVPDNLYGVFIFVGSIFTFAVGGMIVFTAVCRFDEFMSIMTMQVAPSQEVIADMVASLLMYAIIGTVLMLYPIVVFFILGGDDQ